MTEIACYSVIHVHFPHFVVRDRVDTIPRREVTSRSVHLFRKLFQLDNMTVTKSAPFVSRILKVRFLVLIHS